MTGVLTEPEARRIASWWHGGQASALYAFASSGHIDRNACLHELDQCSVAGTHNIARMLDELDALRAYIVTHSPGMLDAVREMLRETPSGLRGNPGKFHGETAFGVRAWLRISECVGNADDEFGDVQWRAYYWRVGRRVWSEDDFGFVSYTRFPSVERACAYLDAERLDFDAWSECDEDFDE